jgi:RND family efflux transporter MFP subunit
VKVVLSILLVLLASLVWATGAIAGPYHVDLVTEPAVVPIGQATLEVRVRDAAGKPISGAQVKGIAQMPGMPMGEREQIATPGEMPGTYRIPAAFAMAGGYEARISIASPLGNATATIPLETGKSTATDETPGFPFAEATWVFFGILACVFVVLRMRKTGQRLDLRPMRSTRVLLPLFALIIVGFVATYVVNHFRRPGSMTPVQAQVMEMDTPAPPGVSPVTLATASTRAFAPSVRYSGQAVGFVEQDVYPRVTGTIVWMPYYVGDRVHKGQVLARLDTSQTAPMVGEKQAGVLGARSGAQAAQADYRQALDAAAEAEAEHSEHEAMISEAEANLAAALASVGAAESQVSAAGSDVQNAKAAVSSAEADKRYWTEELKREQSLYSAGAITKDELQKEQADAERSFAALRQANDGVGTAQAKLGASEAELTRTKAEVVAAQQRKIQAISMAMAHHAHVLAANAAAASAKERIGQTSANLDAAQSSLQSAEATEGYTQIQAETDGVVTQRLISPGVLVGPGQPILKVAQIQPIRVQANVAESDLSLVRVGARVESSVSPSLDPSARTGVVECVLPNERSSFLPGQFVSMDIATAAARDALVIPLSALHTESAPSDNDVISTQVNHYVWVATPLQGQPNHFTVDRVKVETGDSSGNFVAIKSGLSEGRQVVNSSAEYLVESQTVVSTDPAETSAAMSAATVEITEQGFVPPSVTLKAGQGAGVTFIRKTDNTCAKEVVFPSLKVTKPLPLNVPVTIELPPQASGEINYVCGMNMLHGKVVVR